MLQLATKSCGRPNRVPLTVRHGFLHRVEGYVSSAQSSYTIATVRKQFRSNSVTLWSMNCPVARDSPDIVKTHSYIVSKYNFIVVTEFHYSMSPCGWKQSGYCQNTVLVYLSTISFNSLSSVTLQPSAAFLMAQAKNSGPAASGLALSSLPVAKHRLLLLPGTESHCIQHNGKHSCAFRMKLGSGMFILFLLPEGAVDTVSLGDGNQLLGNLAFPSHPHTDDLGRLPVRRGGGNATSCTPY